MHAERQSILQSMQTLSIKYRCFTCISMPMQARGLHLDAECKEMQASGLHLNANAGASYKTRMHISLNAKNAHCLFREVLGERLNGTSCNRTPLQTVSLKGHVRCAWLVGILFMTCDERLVGSTPPQVRRLQLRPCHHSSGARPKTAAQSRGHP